MRISAILAALALSVNAATAGVSTAISLDTKDNRIYAVFYESDACQPSDAWKCAYLAIFCAVPEKILGTVLLHLPAQQIMDNYSAGKISVNGEQPDALYTVRPAKYGASWALSLITNKTGTHNLIVSLPQAETIDVDMGDYHRSLRLNEDGRMHLGQVTAACS